MKKIKKDAIIIAILSVGLVLLINQLVLSPVKKTKKLDLSVPFMNHKSAWADSLLVTMSTNEKIGSLFIVDYEDNAMDSIGKIRRYFTESSISGMILKTDSLKNHILCVNDLNNLKVLGFFFNNLGNGGFEYYYENLFLPSGQEVLLLADSSAFNDYCKMITYYYLNMGIKIVNIPGPEILDENSILDSLCLEKFLNRVYDFSVNVQNKNLISCVKTINLELFRDSLLFDKIKFTYKSLINSGISAFFIENDTLVAGQGNNLLSSFLVKELGFNGLLISKINSFSELETKMKSSSDLFVIKESPEKYTKKVSEMLSQGTLTIDEIDIKLKKILLAKSWTGLEKPTFYRADSIESRFNYLKSRAISRKIFEQAVFIIRNSESSIPISNLEKKYHIVTIGKKRLLKFEQISRYYSKNLNFLHINSTIPEIAKHLYLPSGYSAMVLLLNDIDFDSKRDSLIINKIKELNASRKLIIIDYCKYKNFKHFKNAESYIQVLNNSEENQLITCEALFGGIDVGTNIPYSLFQEQNIKTRKTKKIRLQYSWPEEAGILDYDLSKIDSVVIEGLKVGAYPGCQVFVAKQGKIIYFKSFGYHSYSGKEKVKWNDMYDIASVTKAAATTIAVMKMVDLGKMSLNDKLENFFTDLHIEYTKIKPDTTITIDTMLISDIQNLSKFVRDKDTVHLNDSLIVIYDTLFSKVTPKLNIFKCKVKELLMHKSGLPPAIPILRFLLYRKDTVLFAIDSMGKMHDSISALTRKDTLRLLYDKYYSNKFIKDTSEVQIAEGFYLRNDYFDTLWIDIKQIKVYSKRPYIYSDANMIIMQLAIDSANNSSMDKFLEKNIYEPMGLQTMGFKPLKSFKRSRIVPTENDKFWRKQMLHGSVHDPSSALMGGMTGNAGLYTSAHDLGILFQMLINRGVYGGKRYLKSSTVNSFISTQPDSHRGLGFDMAIGSKKKVSKYAPRSTFGHLGYTGTCVWADPENEIVFVFLSNRPHPSDKNWKLNKLRIRERIHDAVYEAIKNSKTYNWDF